MAKGWQPPLPADAFITMEIKAKPDDDPVFAIQTQDPRFTPHARITVNGYSFIPTSQWETPVPNDRKGTGQ